MTHLDSILNSKDITLPTKVHIVKAIVFPVVLHVYESWTIKKAEHQRIYAFKLWCWRRLLRLPWTARRSNQSILKEISLEYSLQGLMLKLRLQYFGHLMQRANSSEKTLMVGKTEGSSRSGTEDEMVGWYDWLNGHEFEQALEKSEGQVSLECCSPWGHRELDISKRQNNKPAIVLLSDCLTALGKTETGWAMRWIIKTILPWIWHNNLSFTVRQEQLNSDWLTVVLVSILWSISRVRRWQKRGTWLN